MTNKDKDFIVSATCILSNMIFWLSAFAFKSSTLVYIAMFLTAISFPIQAAILSKINKEK